MILGVLKESFPGERRVALVPSEVKTLTRSGVETLIETGAGELANFPDAEYADKGARVGASREEVFAGADLIAQVHTYGANPAAGDADLALMRPGQIFVGFADPLGAPERAHRVAERGAVLFSMELIPRITRAQTMDALSSMNTIAGYRAVLLAAAELPRMFPMLMTAAGTVTPAKVLVIGTGVAGLHAIATARRLGGTVQAYDVRPVAREQVESLGAKFVELELDTKAAEDRGGYAKELGEDFYARQRALMARLVAESDVVITTAAVPGKKAPVLITADMVHSMRRDSVIVDLAAERGGNCELTRSGEPVREGGVTILGPHNIASSIPYHASQMYARNVSNFLQVLVKEGAPQLDSDDEIVRETLVTRDGRVVSGRVAELLAAAR